MTGKELMAFAESKLGTAYVYGTKGEILTQKRYQQLKQLYGSLIWESDRKKIGQVCVDCSGLISWATGVSRNSQGYHDTAAEVFPISTIAQAPIGAAVWKKGHIGIYIGNGSYIAADGSAYGVRQAKLSENSFTHWFLLRDIDYSNQTEEGTPQKEALLFNDKTYTVEMIRYQGTTYLKTRDIAAILNLEVSSNGKTPILRDK